MWGREPDVGRHCAQLPNFFKVSEYVSLGGYRAVPSGEDPVMLGLLLLPAVENLSSFEGDGHQAVLVAFAEDL